MFKKNLIKKKLTQKQMKKLIGDTDYFRDDFLNQIN